MLHLKYCFKRKFQGMGRECSGKPDRHSACSLGADILLGKTDNNQVDE